MSTDNSDAFPDKIAQGTSIDYNGIIFVQQLGGNLQVFTGEVENLDCLVWESELFETPSTADYESTLRRAEGQLFTAKRPANGSGGSAPFRTPFKPGNYSEIYFILDCDGSVGIYDTPNIDGAKPLWSENKGYKCDLAPPSCTRTVLMTENQRVQSNKAPLVGSKGAFIGQDKNGNVFVKRGTPANPGDFLWQSCSKSNTVTEYFTALQSDSQFITRPVDQTDLHVWKRDDFIVGVDAPVGVWELALECVNGDYGKLVISDSLSKKIEWEDDLRPDCDAEPLCPSATLLLDTDHLIWNKNKIEIGDGYTLEQKSNGELKLWKGDEECVLWESSPVYQPTDGDAYTKMQGDGNLVTYWRTQTNNFGPIWASGSRSKKKMGSFTFVIDSCIPASGANPRRKAVAVYENNPITDSNAKKLWQSEEFDDVCPSAPARRDRGLRGSDISP